MKTTVVLCLKNKFHVVAGFTDTTCMNQCQHQLVSVYLATE